MSWLRLSILCCALLMAPTLFADPATAKDDSKKNAPAASSDDSNAPKPSSDADKEKSLLDSLPANQIYNGVHIPNFSPSGKLLMLFDAKSAKRIDDRNIEMQDLKIEIHNNDGSTFHVEMQHSLFNLDTRILTSNTPTTIKRDDFTINGDRAEFHVKEKFGRVFGNVKMIINSGDADTSGSTDSPGHPKKGKKNKAAQNNSPGVATPADAASPSTAATPPGDKNKPADTHK